jgi:hypothetical protein
VQLSSLTSLQDQPDEAASFPVSATFYTSLCNVIGSDQKGHDVLYVGSHSERLAPYITCSLENGVYHYSVASGKEESVLGYAQPIDFGDRFAASAASESNVWIYLSPSDPHPSQKSDGLGKDYDEYLSNDGTGELFISLHEGSQPAGNQSNQSINTQPATEKLLSQKLAFLTASKSFSIDTLLDILKSLLLAVVDTIIITMIFAALSIACAIPTSLMFLFVEGTIDVLSPTLFNLLKVMTSIIAVISLAHWGYFMSLTRGWLFG